MWKLIDGNKRFFLLLIIVDISVGLPLLYHYMYGVPNTVARFLFGNGVNNWNTEPIALAFSVATVSLLMIETVMMCAVGEGWALQRRNVSVSLSGLISEWRKNTPLVFSTMILSPVPIIRELFWPYLVFRNAVFRLDFPIWLDTCVFTAFPIAGILFCLASIILAARRNNKFILGEDTSRIDIHVRFTAIISDTLCVTFALCWLVPGMINGYWYCYVLTGLLMIFIGVLFVPLTRKRRKKVLEKNADEQNTGK